MRDCSATPTSRRVGDKPTVVEGSTAIDTCRHGVELATDPVSRVYTSLFLGYAYLEHGELARALAELEPAIVRFRKSLVFPIGAGGPPR